MSEDMTNHEAVEFLKNMIGEESGRAIGKDGFYAELMSYHVKALKKGITALEAEARSSENPNNCEDAISRQAALDIVHNGLGLTIGRVEQKINELPPVTAEPTMGHWIQKDKGDGFINWRCSNCEMLSRSSQRPWYKFCPGCGAKMEVTE